MNSGKLFLAAIVIGFALWAVHSASDLGATIVIVLGLAFMVKITGPTIRKKDDDADDKGPKDRR